MSSLPTENGRRTAEQDKAGPGERTLTVLDQGAYAERPQESEIDLAHGTQRPVAPSPEVKAKANQLATMSWSPVTDVVTLDEPTRELLNGSSLRSSTALSEVLALIHAEDRSSFAAQLKACYSHGREFATTFRLNPAESKKPRLIECLGRSKQRAAGYPASVVCVCRETEIVDERYVIESNAEDEAKTTNDLLARVTHEIRTPLNAILGFSQLLMHETSLTEHQLRFVQTIANNGEDLLQTVGDVLSRATNRSKKPSIQNEAFRLRHFMGDLIEMFSASADNGVDVKLEMTGEDGLIYSDRIKIRRILVNLIGNALKFTSSGHIILRGGLETSGSDGSADLRLKVIDSGVGIPEEELDRIFKPYRQLDHPDSVKEGVGLGLTICQDLVQLLKGTIRVTSKVGTGSTFIVTLPVRVLEDSGPTGNSTDNLHPLVIGEDNFHTRLIEKSLAKLGYEAPRIDAPDALNQHTVDQQTVLLVDLTTATNGPTTLRQLSAQLPAQSKPPIVAMCESLTEQTCTDILAAGAANVLVKPFSEHDLQAALNALPRPGKEAPTSSAQEAFELQRPNPTRLPMATLPQDLAESMCEAARQADLDSLHSLIEQLEAVDKVLAEDFRSIAGQMDYDALLQALKMDLSQSLP